MIKAKLKNKVFILDGAIGTQLQKKGMPQGVCPEIWVTNNSDVIKSIYKDYEACGSQAVLTCTFGANKLKLAEYEIKNARKINRDLARIAKVSVSKNCLVGGDIGPTGKFVEPFGSLKFEDAVKIFKEQVKGLLEGGVDFFVIETMMDIQEARAALIAVKELTDKFTIVTMTYDKSGRTLNGTCPAAAIITLQSLGADAVGCNCSTGPKSMVKFIASMKPYAKVPLVAKPNAGMPKLHLGKTVFSMMPKEFGKLSKDLVKAGASIIGGCCGTSPQHIKELKKAASKLSLHKNKIDEISFVSSASKALVLDRNNSLYVIGERINPTGKKILQQELLNNKFSYLKQLAKEQKQNGAQLLDVNVGVANGDEKKLLPKAVKELVPITDLPLVLDSSNVAAVEAALRIYPGRAVVNSISAEKEKINKLLPIVAKYGAVFILLPLTDKEIPAKFEKRKQIIKEIFKKASKLGFTKSDIIVDGLALTVSANPESAKETLKTISFCANEFKVHTVLGLSNISFGLCNRKWINSAFSAMAQNSGLSMVIANPSSLEQKNISMAADVLNNKNQAVEKYISLCTADKDKKESKETLSTTKKIRNAVIDGDKDKVIELIKLGLKEKKSAQDIVSSIMVPAIVEVGELFDKKEYFLPQLISSAETMKKGINFLEPYLKKSVAKNKKATVLLATVKGDIHDIGKNIVALMLSNYGFEVVDLGKDVSPRKIINAIKKHKADIVGLSALMTTTMVNIKDVVSLVKKEKINCKFLIGGAVVTKSYADSIGVSFAKDGVDAVRVASKLVRK